MFTSIESVSETMIILMKSTGSYVANKIPDINHRTIYIEAMQRCIDLVTKYPNQYDFYRFELELRYNYELGAHTPRFWNKKERERYYASLAPIQALEIVEKLYARFITGMSDTEPRNYKEKSLHVYADNNVFN